MSDNTSQTGGEWLTTPKGRVVQAAWLGENRQAIERIGEWSELNRWNERHCENDCGNCHTCGLNYATSWIITMLSNAALMPMARERAAKHAHADEHGGAQAKSSTLTRSCA